jgi:hypothetical protein
MMIGIHQRPIRILIDKSIIKILTLFVMVKKGHVVHVESIAYKTIELRVVFGKILAANYVKSPQCLLLQFKLIQTWLLAGDKRHPLLVHDTTECGKILLLVL